MFNLIMKVMILLLPVTFFTGCDQRSNQEYDSMMPIEKGWEGVPWATPYENISDELELGNRAKRSPDSAGRYTLSGWVNRRVAGVEAEGHLSFSKNDRFCTVILRIQEFSLGVERLNPIIENFSSKYGSAENKSGHLEWYFKGTKIVLKDFGDGNGAGINISSLAQCSRAEREHAQEEAKRS
jgi:hypothetical protein